MSLVEFYKPRSLSPARLDRYLAAGWFRSSNGLFRNKILCLEGKLCSVVNLRLPLKKHVFPKAQQRILNKTGHFRIEIAPLHICEEMQELYSHTKGRFKGFVFPDLYSFLYDFLDRKIFSSWHVKVYDENRLVAASIFDFGVRGVMSVLGVYDPEYKKYSPGILTMLHEIDWAKQNGFAFYYPGYVLDEVSTFDYKLGLGDYTYLSKYGGWISDFKAVVAESPVDLIYSGSDELEKALQDLKIPYQRLLYKLFSLGYAYPEGTFLRHQIIFILPELSDNPFKISVASYDYEMDIFRLCHPLPIQDEYLAMNQSGEFNDANIYYDMILQDSIEDDLYAESGRDLATEIQRIWNKKSSKRAMSHAFLGKT